MSSSMLKQARFVTGQGAGMERRSDTSLKSVYYRVYGQRLYIFGLYGAIQILFYYYFIIIRGTHV